MIFWANCQSITLLQAKYPQVFFSLDINESSQTAKQQDAEAVCSVEYILSADLHRSRSCTTLFCHLRLQVQDSASTSITKSVIPSVFINKTVVRIAVDALCITWRAPWYHWTVLLEKEKCWQITEEEQKGGQSAKEQVIGKASLGFLMDSLNLSSTCLNRDLRWNFCHNDLSTSNFRST